VAGTAAGLLAAGFVARIREDYEAAGCLLDEALALARATDHAFVTAAVLHHLGMIGTDVRQDHAAARGLLQESLALYQKLGLPRFMALVSLTLGEVARAEGNHDGARDLLAAEPAPDAKRRREAGRTRHAGRRGAPRHDDWAPQPATCLAAAADQLRTTTGTGRCPSDAGQNGSSRPEKSSVKRPTQPLAHRAQA